MSRALIRTTTAVAVLAVASLVLGACSASRSESTRPAAATGPLGTASSTGPAPTDPTDPAATDPAATDPASATGSAGAATAGLTGTTGGVGSTSTRPCTQTVGSQLRERTTVGSGGAVAVLAGALDCRAVGIWTSTFTLDQDAAADPTPRFVGLYTGSRPITARVPAVTGPCSASAVYFAVDADGADDTASAARAAGAIRVDLATWPAGRTATVPASSILAGRASGVLAGTVTGDPSRCSPGENIATPQAAVGDCWLAAPDPGSGSGFRRSGCTAAHTHEVYWAESLTPQAYEQQTKGRTEPASAWARQRAVEVCQARRGSLRLAPGVRAADVALELLWPSGLEYPPATGTSAWSRAQVVCLARWQDGKAATRRILKP